MGPEIRKLMLNEEFDSRLNPLEDSKYILEGSK